MRRKVCVVVTARPSYSRIKTALAAIKEHPELDLQLIIAASALLDRYGSAVRYIEEDGFDISARVYMVMEGENLTTMAKTTGIGIIELATAFDNLKPDIVVTIADRYETIATAIAASYMNIPVAHVQGGEITGSIDEKVRHSVTKLSNIHFVSTQKAFDRVVRMGENPENVFITGCPSIDIAKEVSEKPDLNFNPFEKYLGVGEIFDLSSNYIVVLQHPVTTEYDDSRSNIDKTLQAIKKINCPTLWFWPNVDGGSEGTAKGIRHFREVERAKNIHYFKSMIPQDFLRLVYNSNCIVGNSSVAIRECSYLGTPAVNIGSRQDLRERGSNVIDVNYDTDEICRAIQYHVKNGRAKPDIIYGDGEAGKKIAGILSTVPLSVEKRLCY